MSLLKFLFHESRILYSYFYLSYGFYCCDETSQPITKLRGVYWPYASRSPFIIKESQDRNSSSRNLDAMADAEAMEG